MWEVGFNFAKTRLPGTVDLVHLVCPLSRRTNHPISALVGAAVSLVITYIGVMLASRRALVNLGGTASIGLRQEIEATSFAGLIGIEKFACQLV